MPGLDLNGLRGKGSLGPIDYEADLKRIQLQTMLDNYILSGKIKYNGDWDVGMNTNLMGGKLSLGVNGGVDQDKKYYLNYKKRL